MHQDSYHGVEHRHTAADARGALDRLLAAQRDRPGALLPVLHAIQDAAGHVPSEAIPAIARALRLSRAEVHGVITFYPHFRRHPPGRHVVQICQAEACQSMGAVALTAHAEKRLGAKLHETSADRAFTVEAVYCLGNCALSPAIMIDGALHGRLTPSRFDQIVAGLDGAK